MQTSSSTRSIERPSSSASELALGQIAGLLSDVHSHPQHDPAGACFGQDARHLPLAEQDVVGGLDRGLGAERGDCLNDRLGGDGRERSESGSLDRRSQAE
jgi:hypothetical protein